MPEDKRKRIAQETLDIFAPLANRLGIWQIKWELEDLGFPLRQPRKIQGDRRATHRKTHPTARQQIERSSANISSNCSTKHNIQAEISGRPKHIYSIYKKMTQEGQTLRPGARCARRAPDRPGRASLLRRPGRDPHPLASHPRRIRRLHRRPQG
ncbi:MAG: HD domain-containing protein [Desulfobacterales bacterium]|nr:HD domain-containing protein [Desulfobacterales bacterium]